MGYSSSLPSVVYHPNSLDKYPGTVSQLNASRVAYSPESGNAESSSPSCIHTVDICICPPFISPLLSNNNMSALHRMYEPRGLPNSSGLLQRENANARPRHTYTYKQTTSTYLDPPAAAARVTTDMSAIELLTTQQDDVGPICPSGDPLFPYASRFHRCRNPGNR